MGRAQLNGDQVGDFDGAYTRHVSGVSSLTLLFDDSTRASPEKGLEC